MLGSLSSDTLPVGIEAPDGASVIGVTFKPDRPHPSVAMASRIRDANGRYFTYIMGSLDDGEWQTMEHSLDRPGRRGRRALRPQSPVSVVSLSIFETSGRNRLRAGSMVIDEIFARMPDGDRRVLETFESTSEWSMLRAVPEAGSDLLKPAEFGMNNSSAGQLHMGGGASAGQPRNLSRSSAGAAARNRHQPVHEEQRPRGRRYDRGLDAGATDSRSPLWARWTTSRLSIPSGDLTW